MKVSPKIFELFVSYHPLSELSLPISAHDRLLVSISVFFQNSMIFFSSQSSFKIYLNYILNLKNRISQHDLNKFRIFRQISILNFYWNFIRYHRLRFYKITSKNLDSQHISYILSNLRIIFRNAISLRFNEKCLRNNESLRTLFFFFSIRIAIRSRSRVQIVLMIIEMKSSLNLLFSNLIFENAFTIISICFYENQRNQLKSRTPMS